MPSENQQVLRLRRIYSMKNFLASDRSKWIFLIALISIGAGFSAKNVISYPSECVPIKDLEVTMLIRPLV